MSALGQKQTFAVQYVVSALHPKADMCGAKSDVRLVPIADIVSGIRVNKKPPELSPEGFPATGAFKPA